ncbi:GNAT family N-acetyltransferase [Streptomyces sp. NRRL B-3648]|uniref:GNAT family N-acetyltransferase n=1 Tax=Streptomyces sp. NRRL B-3648 TaxID=1519493 RepID=UPI000A9FFD52|nr:GNAT family N-acetyltransferase [Streptomyces sp. NRRL B-3648]
MTERTIYLDPDARPSKSRKITVRAHRWYASVELDRDDYVDATSTRGQEPELPSVYKDTVDRVRLASTDRIWYDGYSGDFSWSEGARWITIPVQFSQVEATVEALRCAEIEDDYSQLHALADRLDLPIEQWLSPGERELVRGVDFQSPPHAFLNFLRGKANQWGLRLNGRATAGSVWVRPTVSAIQKTIREMHPEQYPGWVDHWSGYVESDDAPLRPWVGGREQNLSHGATPVRFDEIDMKTSGDCPCGMSLRDQWDDGRAHASHHAAWAFGIRVPKNLMWPGNLAVVRPDSPISWRKLAAKAGRMPMRENRYDFNSWDYLDAPEEVPDNDRAFLLKANEYVIGYLVATDASEHSRWDLLSESSSGAHDGTLRPRIDLIWIAGSYRRQGLGVKLVQALADDFGCQIGDVSWSTPISDAGRHLARRLSPEGIWVG